MSRKYRVMQEIYVNKYGGREPRGYYIQYVWCKIFGWEIWSRISHTEYGWGGSCEVVTKFKTAKEARDHIKDLCSRIHNGKWTKEVVSIHQCGE